MIASTVASVLLLIGVIALARFGMRAGDRPGDALLLRVEPRMAPRGASVNVTNPSEAPVILGMSLRRAGLRLRLEGSSYVRVRTGSTASELLPDGQTRIGVLDVGETRTFLVPAGAQVPRRAELVVVVGQLDRLRILHRLVVLGGRPRRAGRRVARVSTAPPPTHWVI